MKKVKIRTKRQLDARHEADEAVLAHRARRAREAEAQAEVRASGAVHRPTPEEIERFAVGGGCGGGCSGGTATRCAPPVPICRPTSINDCYHEVASKHGCPMKVTSGGVLGVDGQTRIQFVVEPTQSNYFLPIAVRLVGRSQNDPDQRMLWRLTAVSVKNHPQENFHDPNPNATTVVGVESVAYDGKTAGDVPGWETAWGPFSRKAQADHLELTGWNPYPAGRLIDARAEIWGYEIDSLPDGWKCGSHPGRVAVNLVANPASVEVPTARGTAIP